jgi:hypothetical protein
MLKKLIPADILEIGMYVLEFDRPWLGTPFQYQGFQITSDGEIADLRKLCKNVFIDADTDLPTGDSRARGSSDKSVDAHFAGIGSIS